MRTLSITTIVILQSIHIFTNYTNYGLYSVVPVNIKQLEFLRSILEVYNIDFWKEPGSINKSVQFMISQQDKKGFLKDSVSWELNVSVITEDLQSVLDKQIVKKYLRNNIKSFDWDSYKRLDDIYDWLKDLASSNQDILSVYSIGKSFQGREIYCCEVDHKTSRKRSTVIIEGGIHAREWISPAFVTYALYAIVTGLTSNDVLLSEIAGIYKWYFIPVLNPDGYEYSHVHDRLWRKNLRNVDLNRNFDIEFGTVGVKPNKSYLNYPGEYAFSEDETKAFRSLLMAKGGNLEYFLSIHSFGQYMIIPYEYSENYLENYYEVSKKSKRAAIEIRRRYGTEYFVGNLYDTLGYLSSGCSSSWVKKTFTVPYVLTLELRDKGAYGFLLPADQILPTCYETLDGILSFLTPEETGVYKLNSSCRLLQVNIFKFSILLTVVLLCNMFLTS